MPPQRMEQFRMNFLKRAAVYAMDLCLPRKIKSSFVHLSYHLDRTEFERFAHTYCIGPSMRFGLESLAARGFSPGTVVDVGAYEGSWTMMAHSIWPSSRAIMIEPNYSKQLQLAKLAKTIGATLCVDLLGANCEHVVAFNLMETGSSIMNENSTAERTVEVRNLRTLDSLALHIDGTSNLLKIDAQGYELEILKGAAECLKVFEAVLLEVALIEINEGAPLLHDVLIFMDKLGFVAGEILEVHRRPLDNAMSQIDIIFIQKGSVLLADRRFSH
jgi:FkbM family methyltransferase